MTEYRKGDVCSLEVVVQDVRLSGDYGVMLLDAAGNTHMPIASPSDLTLVRRAPVDLASVEIPKEGLLVQVESGDHVTMVGRDGDMAWLRFDMQSYDSRLLSDLRPIDAPAPRKGDAFDVRAYVDGYEFRGDGGDYTPTEGDKAMLEDFAEGLIWDLSRGNAPAPDKSEVEYNARLRQQIENSMDDWSKALGWGLTGAQPECWALMDATVRQHVEMRREVERLLALADAALKRVGELSAIRGQLLTRNAGLFSALKGLMAHSGIADVADGDKEPEDHAAEASARKALASTASTCPPGHIMIGDRAVPEPMREAPDVGTFIYSANPGSPGLVGTRRWANDFIDRHQLMSGLIYPGTNEGHRAARAHAEAIIALSAGEGV